jgi:hypothetical protein
MGANRLGRGVDALLRKMKVIMRVASWSLLAIAVLTPTPLFAQSTLQQPIQPSKPTSSSTLPTSQGKSVHAYVGEFADLSRAGNADATRELT